MENEICTTFAAKMEKTKKQSYIKHYKGTLRLGIPLCIGQVGIILVGFADTIMVGRYGTDDLASVSFVNNVFNLVVITLLGFSYGITPIIGSMFGRGDTDGIGYKFRNALIANVALGLLLTVVMGALYFFIDRLGQPSELLPTIRPYYLVILASMVFVAIFNALRQFTDSLMRPSVGMWILLSGNAVNIVFNYLLIYGKLGFPELGALGAGISTLGARILMVVVFVVILMCGKAYDGIRRSFFSARARFGEILSIAKTSLPISLQMAMETGAFTVGGVMMGWIGAVELASFQVVITIGTLGFMLYYSIGAAMAIREANYYGREDYGNVNRAAWSGYHILLSMVVCVSALFYFFGESLIGMFTNDVRVAETAFALIPLLMIYQLGDATQIGFSNSLRGISHTVSIMWVAFVSYIVVGIPGSYLLGFPLGLGKDGVFMGFCLSLFTAGALFLWQFVKAMRR